MSNPQSRPLNQEQVVRSETGLKRLLAGPIFVCLLLTSVTLAVYCPVRNFDFINYDDHDYVSENHHVLAGLTKSGIRWAFTTGHTANWHPLTWLSHMLDVELFGRDAGGPHMANLFFHVVNTLVLFLFLRQFTGTLWRSAFVAALFALHPLHVESVAWISERKDVLSTFFGLLTLVCYGYYAQRRHSAAHLLAWTSTHYWLALLFFALGLMSKPMLVTLPFVMLLLDLWPLQRFTVHSARSALKPLISEKLPFFVLCAASCVVTFAVQHEGGAVKSLSGFPLTARIQNALVSYARYLGKTLWPVDLANPYPYQGQWHLGWVILAAILIAGLCIVAVWLGRRRPYVFTGWFWFLGMLVPVIGLIQVGVQSMADRYTYMPLIGVFIVAAWGMGEFFTLVRLSKPAIAAGALLLVGACAARTADQVRLWQDSGILSSYAIAVTKNNSIAYQNLGNYFLEKEEVDKAMDNFQKTLQTLPAIANSRGDLLAVLVGEYRVDEASEKLRRALEADPSQMVTCAEVLNSLGTALVKKGREDEAISHYRAALRLVPKHAMALHNLGYELATRKQHAEAIDCLEAAVRAKPDQPDMRHSLGDVLVEVGRIDEAIQQFREALRFAPNNARVLNSLGLALAAQGRAAEAIEQYKAALRADPKLIEVHNNLGSALVSTGNLDEAIQQFRQLLQWMPTHGRAHDNLGIALAMKGDLEEAVVELQQAIQCNPEYANTHFNLGNVLALQRRFDEAIAQYEETLRLNPNHAQAHCHLGGALAETGRRQEAIKHLNEALRLQPDYPKAKEQLEALSKPAN